MAQVNRANVAANLNTGSAWLGGGSGTGGQPGSVDIAAWGTPNIPSPQSSQALGGAVSWQGLLLQSAQTTNISIGATSAAITIGASGIDLSAAGANLTIASPVTVTLGASQQWIVASGRTLTVTGVISGTGRNVTFTGGGTTSISNINTAWTNSQLIVAGGLVIATDNRAIGASTNSVVVQSGGALRLTGASTINPTSFVVSGQGASGLQAGAIYISDSSTFATGKTIELQGASPTIGVNAGVSGSFAGGIIGSPTGDVTFNMVGTNTANPTFTGTSSTFTVQSGQRVVLQGVNPVGAGVETAADFFFGATDLAGLGNAANKVTVKNSVRLTTVAPNLPILSRDYFFEGETSFTTPIAPKVASIAPVAGNTAMTFQGTITGTAGNWVKASVVSGSGVHPIKFAGALQGSWNLRSFSAVQTIYLDTPLDVSGWTGNLWAYRVAYGKAPTGAVTYDSNAIIDNISGSDLTLAHSGYTLVGSLTFTGSSPMSLGLGNVTVGTSPTITVSASTLTIPGNIGTPTTLVKNGAGTLILSGNNTFSTSITLSAGALVLNSAGSAGGTGTQFVFVNGTELDSTTGAVLNQTGTVNTGSLGGSWTWKGTDSLTFGSGNVTTGGSRTITFAGGGLGTLKFRGAVTTATLGTIWEFGGAIAGAKQRVTLGGANASLANATSANQHAITAGYFRIENNDGLGASGTTTTWWVGAANTGTQTTKAALELAGVTTPNNKNIKLYNIGPTDDGALIGASGTSVFSGNIEVPNVAGTRIGVKTGATLTLLGSDIYPNLNPANANTPLSFTAESGGTLNQNRILGGPTQVGSNVSTVTVANSLGTVVFSRANLHTGAMTCSSGTTKLTHANAAGATSGNNVTVSSGATMEVTVKVIFPATLTLGSTGSAATFKVSV